MKISIGSIVCFVLVTVSTGLIGQTVPIAWEYDVNVDVISNAIKKNNPLGWDAWARSKNEFDANESAILIYRADPVSGNKDLVVAVGEYTTTYDFGQVEFGFYVTTTDIHTVVNGSISVSTARSSGSEELKLKRVPGSLGTWKMQYYIDGTLVDMQPCNGLLYKAYGLIYGEKQMIRGLKAELIVDYAVTDASCPDQTLGEIDLTVSGGVPPYDILWSNSATTEDITGLVPGSYSVTITDDIGSVVNATYDVLYQIAWNYQTDVTTTPNSIVKTSGAPVGYGGAESHNKIDPGTSGYIRFNPTMGSGNKYIGFAVTNNNTSPTTIEYGMLFGLTAFAIVESGSIMYTGSFTDQDAFKIEKSTSGGFKYYKNSVLLPYTSSGSSTATYVADVSTNASVEGFPYVGASFCNYQIVYNETYYAETKDLLDGGFQKVQGSDVKFVYRNEYADQTWKYRIINNSGTTVYDQNNGIISNDILGGTTSMKEGRGHYSIDVSGFVPGLYVLEITNSKGEKSYLRFKV